MPSAEPPANPATGNARAKLNRRRMAGRPIPLQESGARPSALLVVLATEEAGEADRGTAFVFGFVCFGGCCDSNMQCVDLGNTCVDGSTCSPGPFLNLCGAPTGGGGGSSSGGGGGSSSGGGGGAATGGGAGGGAATGGGTGTGGGGAVAGPLYAKVQCRSDADCPSGTCDLAQPGGVCAAP